MTTWKNVEDRRAYARAYYHAREKSGAGREKRMAANLATRQRLFAFVAQIRASSPCIKCGASHPAVIDFHHRDPAKKVDEVANMMRKGASRKRIMDEIAKCDPLCSNCHRILHWEERGGGDGT